LCDKTAPLKSDEENLTQQSQQPTDVAPYRVSKGIEKFSPFEITVQNDDLASPICPPGLGAPLRLQYLPITTVSSLTPLFTAGTAADTTTTTDNRILTYNSGRGASALLNSHC
jgi:hypothetical protein